MAVDGSKQAQASTAQIPRKINVHRFAEARATELESLHSTIANRVKDDFRSQRNKRRRTAAFDSKSAKRRYRKRQKVAVFDNNNNNNNNNNNKAMSSEKDVKTPRRVRRRLELKKNPESGFCTSGDGTKRLRTHVWHAKRFTMKKLWGFHLPLGLQGRGKGSRAVLKWLREGVLIHDASYNVAIQLEGRQDSLISVLQMVLAPSPVVKSEDSSVSLSGHTYGTAMLCHVGGSPSKQIAPVKYIWRPCREGGNVDKDHAGVGSAEHHAIADGSCFRQLWIWIHASAFDEGFSALRFACEKQMNEGSSVISFFSREGELAKLELFGPKAFELIQKAAQPVACLNKRWQSNGCSGAIDGSNNGQDKYFPVLENEEAVPSHAILSYTVIDPRLISAGRIVDDPKTASTINKSQQEAEKSVPFSDVPDRTQEIVSSLWLEASEHDSSSNKTNLWETTVSISLPEEDHVLCAEKHNNQMDFFCLNRHSSENHTNLDMVHHSRSCSVMLLKDNDHDSPPRWSVVLPLSWVKVFWIFLISKGGRAIGQRERRWVACEIGIPYFPSDFPDCNAYSSFMEGEAVANENVVERRPPALRPFKVPIQPPWNAICVSVRMGTGSVQDTKTSNGKDIVGETSSRSSTCEPATTSDGDKLFSGFISRTSSMFSYFSDSILSNNLILHPQDPIMKSALMEFMRDKSLFENRENPMTKIGADRELCFLRVHLRAYKEGIFEDGAVVCAPSLTDISLWTSSSSSSDSGFQMSQLLVRSYFKEQSSGRWELQVPEDPAAQKAFRWPIGFVTTGFIRGSKKPKAEALCEAGLLSGLREEQWAAVPAKKRKKEVYVLVRNLRSSSYRLALATIVLEQQQDDLLFM